MKTSIGTEAKQYHRSNKYTEQNLNDPSIECFSYDVPFILNLNVYVVVTPQIRFFALNLKITEVLL